MKTRILIGILGTAVSAVLLLTFPVLAHDSHYRGGHVDHDYSEGGHVDHEYGNSWHVDHDYSGGGHVDHEYRSQLYYDRNDLYDYGHPSGALG